MFKKIKYFSPKGKNLGFFSLSHYSKKFTMQLTTYKNPKNNYLFVGTQTCKEPSTVEFSLRK